MTYCVTCRFKVCPNGSVNVEKSQNRGAILISQPRDPVVARLRHKKDYQLWIIKNLPLILEYAEKNGYSEDEVIADIRFPFSVTHTEKWAWAFWDHLSRGLHFEVALGVKDMAQVDSRWGFFSEPETAYTRVGPSNFRPYTMAPSAIDAQNPLQFLRNANQQSESEGDKTDSTKDPISHTSQENFSYPFKVPFANPQAILYDGFKLKHDKTLTELLSAPFRRNKPDQPLKDVNLKKEAKKEAQKAKRKDKQEEDDDDDNEDGSDDHDDIMLTYLLVVRSLTGSVCRKHLKSCIRSVRQRAFIWRCWIQPPPRLYTRYATQITRC